MDIVSVLAGVVAAQNASLAAYIIIKRRQRKHRAYWDVVRSQRCRNAYRNKVESRSAESFEERVERWTEADYRQKFRFKRTEIERLIEVLDVESCRYRNRYKPSPFKAMCILLWRLGNQSTLSSGVETFDRGRTYLSLVSNDLAKHLSERYKGLLDWDARRLTLDYLKACARQLEARGCNKGVWGFIDGTFIETARPGEHQVFSQRELYSGHKKKHGIQFQGITTPDGMLSIAGPYRGNVGDMKMLVRSKLDDKLRAIISHLPEEEKLWLYGDKGYYAGSWCVYGAAKRARGQRRLADEPFYSNVEMSRYRIEVEHAFGHVVNTFKFVDGGKKLRVGLTPVAAWYRVAVLLVNCLTCMRDGGNQTNIAFEIRPPTLDEYLRSVNERVDL